MKDMMIQGMGVGDIGQLPGVDKAKASQASGDGKSFVDTLKESIAKVDSLQMEAHKAVQELASGSGDIHNTMIAMEKASISFQAMMQVRNKIVTAYEEVMRTQV